MSTGKRKKVTVFIIAGAAVMAVLFAGINIYNVSILGSDVTCTGIAFAQAVENVF